MMKYKIFYVVLFIQLLYINIAAQEPESFFPHGVGDVWNYSYSDGRTRQIYISRDSIGPDGSHNLFYGTASIPDFRIDTAFNVFKPNARFYHWYKLDADTGEVWENPESGTNHWAWVARIESITVFSKLTVAKIFRYSAGRPDSADSPAFAEAWLASGFGLVYGTDEGGFVYLEGCIIAGDTFGFITSINKTENVLPSSFLLKQNYPNPFNPTTTIEFNLPKEAEIRLTIFDILGQQITVLYEGGIGQGNHKIKWDAGGLPGGVYLCNLIANGNNKTIKMLLAK